MYQTDSKRLLAMVVGALSILCVKTCPENHFQLADSLCCLNCDEGWYVTQNCSKGNGAHTGVVCNKCHTCEDGQRTVSNCTQFTDTQCMDQEKDQPLSTLAWVEGQPSLITLYGCSSAVAAVFLLAVIVPFCLIRISKSGESDESSEGEPFHVKEAETV